MTSPHVPQRALDTQPRTYTVKTLGCQMNVHDSEHMAGLLEQAGYVKALMDQMPLATRTLWSSTPVQCGKTQPISCMAS